MLSVPPDVIEPTTSLSPCNIADVIDTTSFSKRLKIKNTPIVLLELVFVDCVVSPQSWKHHWVESVLVHERVMELTHDILVVRIKTRVL